MNEKEKKAVEEYMKKLKSYMDEQLYGNWFSYAEDKIYDEPKTFNMEKFTECEKIWADLDKEKIKWKSGKIYWDIPVAGMDWASSPPDIFSLPPVPPQDPSTIAATMKQEWNL